MSKKKITGLILIIVVLICVIVGIVVIPKIFNYQEKSQDNNEIDNDKKSEIEYKVIGGAIYETLEPLNENGISNNIVKINNVCNKYLENSNIYFALIPNKEYYLNNEIGNKEKFSELQKAVKEKLNDRIEYINLYNTLDLSCYYKTDMHWKQENLAQVVEQIFKTTGLLGSDENIKSDYNDEETTIEDNRIEKYEQKSLGDFYGSYYEKIDDETVEPDELIYLTNQMLENCIVYNMEKEEEEAIYNFDRVNETNNKYDLFLSGAASIQKIQKMDIKNNEMKNGKKLIIFRDSFGSSIAPLLLNSYEEILLIDIRYVNSEFLDRYVNFEEYAGQDVLFLYNARVINKSGIFR